MGFFARKLHELKEYNDIASISEIARRYFAMNAFDGVLTIIGVLMGNYAAHVQDAKVVIVTGFSTSIAMGVSGLWGAYMTESAERKRDLRDLRVAVVVVALVDGLAPFLASLVVLLPFFFSGLLDDIVLSYYAALALALGVLFALGAFLGKVSKENLIISGLKMIGAGLVSILLSYFLGVEH